MKRCCGCDGVWHCLVGPAQSRAEDARHCPACQGAGRSWPTTIVQYKQRHSSEVSTAAQGAGQWRLAGAHGLHLQSIQALCVKVSSGAPCAPRPRVAGDWRSSKGGRRHHGDLGSRTVRGQAANARNAAKFALVSKGVSPSIHDVNTRK